MLRLLLLASMLTVASPPAFASASTCFSNSASIRGLRDRFIANPYQRPRYSFHRYMVFGGGRNFVTMVDDDGDFQNGSWSDAALEQRLTGVLDQYYQTQPDTAQFVVLFSSFQVGFPGAFYLPLSNDVRGIGYRHTLLGGRETYDSTEGPLEGILMMNDYGIWGGQGGLSVVFNQELGHRWGSFVHFAEEGDTTTNALLLGRDQAHWSFFMDTGGSPMEGNWWRDNGDGTFTTITTQSDFGYHPLDLYLMGLIPPEEVGEFWFIDNPDLSGFTRPPRPDSGPAYYHPISLPGTKKTLTIEDIIRAEGERVPAFASAPKKFKIGFVLVVQDGQQTDQRLLDEFADTVDFVVAGWEAATGNRATLEIVSSGPPPPSQSPMGSLCDDAFQCDSTTSTACVDSRQDPSVGTFCSRRCSASDPCPTGFCCGPANLLGEPRYCFPEGVGVCPPPPTFFDGGTTTGFDGGAPGPDGGVAVPADGGITPGAGGGCSSAGGHPGLAALLLVLGLGLSLRRRRRALR